MGAWDVVALRSIASKQIDEQVMPMIQKLQQAQDELNERLAKLDFAKQLERLEEKLASKADIDTVPSLAQLLEIEAKSKHDAPSSNHKQIENLVADLEQKVGELTGKLELKANISEVPPMSSIEEVQNLVNQKAGLREMQKLQATIDRKANSSKVPTMAQLEELKAQVANKVDASLCPTVAQVDELAAEVKRKANSSSVVTVAKLDAFAEQLRSKAEADDVVTVDMVEQFVTQKVKDAMVSKADAGDVPTLAQHKELAAVTERKLSFLASKVQQRNNNQWDYCQPVVLCTPQMMEGVSWDQQGDDNQFVGYGVPMQMQNGGIINGIVTCVEQQDGQPMSGASTP